MHSYPRYGRHDARGRLDLRVRAGGRGDYVLLGALKADLWHFDHTRARASQPKQLSFSCKERWQWAPWHLSSGAPCTRAAGYRPSPLPCIREWCIIYYDILPSMPPSTNHLPSMPPSISPSMPRVIEGIRPRMPSITRWQASTRSSRCRPTPGGIFRS